jgi:hypothetical protein
MKRRFIAALPGILIRLLRRERHADDPERNDLVLLVAQRPVGAVSDTPTTGMGRR